MVTIVTMEIKGNFFVQLVNFPLKGTVSALLYVLQLFVDYVFLHSPGTKTSSYSEELG